ncbi:protein-disulfide reductase DsbD domain-containing protein [Pseudooceanicola sp.]|uniref:protein-disulfide reductase DsbD domain-containing protein n=1 Tax=Pseudooceanicola sp. TaxID=1914328 RepID=UPI0035C75049
MMIRILALLSTLAAATPLAANPYADNVSVRLLPGWQQADGSHVAALELRLAEGWKTYWRAPGDAGVPPIFSWGGSDNVASVDVIWPRPEVFYQNGMRSIGYSDTVVLPLHVHPRADGAVALDGELQIGICSDICVPLSVDLNTVALPEGRRPVAAIAAALAERPFSERDAGVGRVTCDVTPAGKRTKVRAEIEMPAVGGKEVVVLETSDPAIWVSEARTQRVGNRLIAEAEMMSMRGGAMMFDRSGVRITVLGGGKAVDIQGCTGR